MGEMKAGSSRMGVPMESSMVCEERVCESGGGTGRAKSCLWPLVKGEPEAIVGCCAVLWIVCSMMEAVCQQRSKRMCLQWSRSGDWRKINNLAWRINKRVL